MCFRLLTKNRYPRPLVAKEDIVVYKRLKKTSKGYKSPYKDFVYNVGYHYYETSSLRKRYTGSPMYNFRLHSFDINEGLHSYKDLTTAMYWKNTLEKIVKMIIPKGAKYYDNGSEIVSTELIFPRQKKFLN